MRVYDSAANALFSLIMNRRLYPLRKQYVKTHLKYFSPTAPRPIEAPSTMIYSRNG
jgi:hypothetical protein